MKKILLMSLLAFVFAFSAIPAVADSLVPSGFGFSNPDDFTANSVAKEEQWLEGLLGGLNVEYLSKDEDSNPLDNVPSGWIYAILKYGNGNTVYNHYAIIDDGDGILKLSDVNLSRQGLSHVTYFAAVPEPSILILLGTGLLGIVGIGRRK